MRRVRRFFVTLCVLALFAAAVPVSAAERNPYQPVRTEMFASGESEAVHMARIYRLSPVDDPSGIPVQDFEANGWVYHMVDMSSEEETGTDSRQITRTVTKSSETDKMEKILKVLDATMEVTTEDGYSGVLRLDHKSVTVEAAEYATRDSAVSATRLYPDLADADLSLIPKTVEENGRTLTLDDVRWESGWQTDADGGFIRYSAAATYIGTVSDRYATGYTVTANYSGEVSRSDVEMITWRVEFAPVREAEPVEAPPEPPQPEEPPQEPSESDNGGDTESDSGQSVTEESPNDTQTVTETSGNNTGASNNDNGDSGKDNGDSGNDNGENSGTEPPAVTPERPKSTPDWSGLKRTLCSAGLLLGLAAVAYVISFIKKRKGGNQI